MAILLGIGLNGIGLRKDELQKLVGLIKVGQIRLGMDIRGIVKDGISGMTKVGVQP